MSDTQVRFLSGRSSNSDAGRCKRTCLCASLTVSLIISIILVASIIVSVLVKPDFQEPASRKNGTVCFVCDYFGSGIESSDTFYNLIKKKDKTFCCLKESNEFSQLFIQMIKNRYQHKAINNISILASLHRNGCTGRHLYIDTHALEEGQLSWSTNNTNSLTCTSGISYKSGFLHVPSPGRYLVYSHIAYKYTSRRSNGPDSFVHRVTRQHPRQPNLGEITLLSSRKSYSRDKKTGSSFLSAILVMRRHDQLAVRVSELDAIYSAPTENYFGILKMY